MEWEDTVVPDWDETTAQAEAEAEAEEDWGDEADQKVDLVLAQRPPTRGVLYAVDAEQFEEVLTAFESLVGYVTAVAIPSTPAEVENEARLTEALRTLVEIVFRSTDPSGMTDAVLLDRVLSTIDSTSAGPVAKTQLGLVLFSHYLRRPEVRERPARGGPFLQRLMKRELRSTLNPVGKTGIIRFMPLRYYSAIKLATFIRDMWAVVDRVYTADAVAQEAMETLVLVVAYHASLQRLGREGEQQMMNWLTTGYRDESGAVRPEAVFAQAHPGPYRFLEQCKYRLAKCQNLTTSQRLPLCDIPRPLLWGPVPSTGSQCYDVRELLPAFENQLSMADTPLSSAAPLRYPQLGARGGQPDAVIPPAVVRAIVRRASRYGLAVPPTLDLFLAGAADDNDAGPRRRRQSTSSLKSTVSESGGPAPY